MNRQMPLSKSELERYQRQITVDGWDQEKLKKAKVLIIGLGGLGGISATYLAAAGVGTLKLCDSDTVELSNLNRQILYSIDDIGKPKITQAQKRLSSLNPEISIEIVADRLDNDNATKIISGCDLIIDGLDNHSDRLVLNSASLKLGIPFIYGAISEWQGQTGFFNPPTTPCLACIMPDILASPKPIPVFGALPGTVGTIQATLAIEYLMGGINSVPNRLLIFNAESMALDTVTFDRRPGCEVCG
jgi:molybdopterin/thiamine biosynthesis adenylyltransferase